MSAELAKHRPAGHIRPHAEQPLHRRRQAEGSGPFACLPIVVVVVDALRGAIAEIGELRIADEGDRLSTGAQWMDLPGTFSRKDQRRSRLAVDTEIRQKRLAPDAGGDVDSAVVAAALRLEPAIADGRDALPDWGRFEHRGGRNAQQVLGSTVVRSQFDSPDAVELIEKRH